MSRRFFQGLVIGAALVGIGFGLWLHSQDIIGIFAILGIFTSGLLLLGDIE